MKTLKFSGLLAIIILCGSCSLVSDLLTDIFDHEPKFANYLLELGFQDASGKDLVKGIELADSLYTLDIILSEPCKNWDNNIYNTRARSGMIPQVYRPVFDCEKLDNGYYVLTNYFSIPQGDCPETKMLTYKLKCPYLFGDDAVHELVTYWNISNKSHENVYGKCSRIEFEGKVFDKITYDGYMSSATIILP